MNGETLTRAHGFPIRLIAPRYYGFKHVKWIDEIAFRATAYYGTWPKMGYTKKPVIHTVSFIDEVRDTGSSLRLGGIAMSGHGGIETVTVRADDGDWQEAELELPLSPFAWTRWKATLPSTDAKVVEARARDARGQWQAAEEGPLFPDGVKGPTIRRIS
jgi:DMSO/TMAO reductase YedYZ molybdopterin-dependent catalytic subunit